MNLNHVTIFAQQPEESVEFYKKLGLRLIVDSLPRYARLECPDGDSTLSVNIAENAGSPAGIYLYFECENLDAVVDGLRSGGLEFDEDPADRPWLWRQAYLRDPDGNKICLYNAGSNRKNPPWRVK